MFLSKHGNINKFTIYVASNCIFSHYYSAVCIINQKDVFLSGCKMQR